MRTLLHSPSSVLSGRRPDGARAGALTWSRRRFVHGLSVASVALLADCRPFSSPAQQPQKIARIGFLSVGPGPPEPGTRPNTQAFRQALRESGYYGTWKEKIGADGWKSLEQSVGSLL